MQIHRVVVAVVIALGTACTSSPAGEPLVTTTLTGDFGGQGFTPVFGFAKDMSAELQLYLGTDAISCADAVTGMPRSGTYVTTLATAQVVGVYSNAFFDFTRVSGTNVDGGGSNAGTVEITAASPAEVTAKLTYDATVSAVHYALTGTVTLHHCP